MSDDDTFAAPNAATLAAEHVIAEAHEAARRLLTRARGLAYRWPMPTDEDVAEALVLVRALGADPFPAGGLRSIAAATIARAPLARDHETLRELALMLEGTEDPPTPSSALAELVAARSEREAVMLAAIELARAARCAPLPTLRRLARVAQAARAAIREQNVEELRDAA